MATRHLINEDGEPFDAEELEALAEELDSLTPPSAQDSAIAMPKRLPSIPQHKY
jgi:hypothetical protein